jgi:hypothetical protein
MAETPTLTRTDRRARRLTKLALAAAIGLAIGNRRGTDPRLLLVLKAHDLDRAVGTRGYRCCHTAEQEALDSPQASGPEEDAVGSPGLGFSGEQSLGVGLGDAGRNH